MFILQTYGYEHLITLMNIEKAGLLRPHGNRTYPAIRKSLKLIIEDVNEQVTYILIVKFGDKNSVYNQILLEKYFSYINMFMLSYHRPFYNIQELPSQKIYFKFEKTKNSHEISSVHIKLY